LWAVPFDLDHLEVTGQPVPVLDEVADTSLERCGCGLRNGVVLLSRSAADTDRTDDLAVLLQRDATSKNHDLAVVGSMDSKELIAGL
jgi:hypothetical protein